MKLNLVAIFGQLELIFKLYKWENIQAFLSINKDVKMKTASARANQSWTENTGTKKFEMKLNLVAIVGQLELIFKLNKWQN